MLQPKKLIVKNSEFKNNSRTSLKKWVIKSTFPVPKKTQNNSRNQGIPDQLGTLKLYEWY